MTDEKLNITAVTAKEVLDFAHQAVADRERIGAVPISLWRARAWACNPCAAQDDVVLLVAWTGGRCAGFLGLMPGRMQVLERTETVYWASAFHVPEQFRHTCAAIVLVQEAMRLGKHIFNTGYSPKVGELYEAMGFRPLGPLRYLSLDVRTLNPLARKLRSLRSKRRRNGQPHTGGLDRLVAGTDWLYKKAVFPLARRRVSKWLSPVEARRVGHISDRWERTEPSAGRQVCFVRGRDVVNWMLDSPWYTTSRDQATAGHYFSDWCPVHRYLAVEIHRKADEAPLGWAVLRLHGSTRHTNVTVCDYRLSTAGDHSCLVALAVRYGCQTMADTIELPEACAETIARSPLLRRLVCPRERSYCWYPRPDDECAGHIPHAIRLTLADGDTVF